MKFVHARLWLNQRISKIWFKNSIKMLFTKTSYGAYLIFAFNRWNFVISMFKYDKKSISKLKHFFCFLEQSCANTHVREHRRLRLPDVPKQTARQCRHGLRRNRLPWRRDGSNESLWIPERRFDLWICESNVNFLLTDMRGTANHWVLKDLNDDLTCESNFYFFVQKWGKKQRIEYIYYLNDYLTSGHVSRTFIFHLQTWGTQQTIGF